MFNERVFGSWGIEHVVLKGNNKMQIFNDSDDCLFFLNLLRSKQENSTSLISYCLMKNHVHLILKDKTPEKISNLIMKVAGFYSAWYNKKYGRENALFRHRFHNESIETEAHLIGAVHYIHNNPVKAGIVKHPIEYHWSSYKEYDGKSKYVDKTFFNECFCEDDYLFDCSQICNVEDSSEDYYRSYECAWVFVKEMLKEKHANDLCDLSKKNRTEMIQVLYRKGRFTYNDIAKILNVSESVVHRALNEVNEKEAAGKSFKNERKSGSRKIVHLRVIRRCYFCCPILKVCLLLALMDTLSMCKLMLRMACLLGILWVCQMLVLKRRGRGCVRHLGMLVLIFLVEK